MQPQRERIEEDDVIVTPWSSFAYSECPVK
jgi:hypothetical protein